MKTVITIPVNHTIGLITNSSSELFVFPFEEKQMVVDMVEILYHDYLNEYDGIRELEELTTGEIDTYITYVHLMQRKKPQALMGLDFSDVYEVVDNKCRIKHYTVNEENRGDIIQKLRKGMSGSKLYFMWSLDDNPDYDKVELLSRIGTHYHLG